MRYIADLHIHSRYSRATSRDSHLHGLAAWAAIKGITVLGTGDFTHPAWFAHLRENLQEAEPGFFQLNPEKKVDLTGIVPEGLALDLNAIRFVLSAEVSSIYKKHGKVRKIHNVLFAPDFEAARRINAVLAGIGNLEADGRPILGLDSRNLLEILLENAPDGFLVPAHIWTPWFSLFGSKSGFDLIEECFDDLSDQIFALETGLSSDPAMNRRISALDRFTLISNSDCHSPGKLGREANIFTADFDYFAMREAIRAPLSASGEQRFTGTIEFYPEEGKYHCDGHRKCGVCLDPLETKEYFDTCPECGRPLTIGVLNRVRQLADRSEPVYPSGSPAVHSLVPLPEILSEQLGVGPASKKVGAAYARLIKIFGSEFELLLNSSISDIEAGASEVLGEAIRRVREGRVIRRPGYDGEFGVIKVFSEAERMQLGGQRMLFGIPPAKPREKRKKVKAVKAVVREDDDQGPAAGELNAEQRGIVDDPAGHIIVNAGPGTGKTHTLVQRVIAAVEREQGPCVVITFTNKAAAEVEARVRKGAAGATGIFVATFHGFCLHWLRRQNPELQVAGPEIRAWLLGELFPQLGARGLRELERNLAAFLSAARGDESLPCPELALYFKELRARQLVDIDEVTRLLVELLIAGGPVAGELRASLGTLFIDEFQDVNHAQYELTRMLAQTCRVFAIGDPDQAIYGFRGADPACFYRFIEQLRPASHVLTRNYRSSPVILQAAHAVISNNPHPGGLSALSAARGRKGLIFSHEAASAKGEAAFVGQRIDELLGGTSHRQVEKQAEYGLERHYPLSDIAVLYRTSSQAGELASELARRGIPFQLIDTTPFYLLEPVAPLYHWVLLAAGAGGAATALGLLAREKNIGPKAVAALGDVLSIDPRAPFAELAARLPRDTRLASPLATALAVLDGRLQKLRRAATKGSGLVAALLALARQCGLEEQHGEVERFVHLAGAFDASLPRFAEHLERFRDSVVYDERAEAVRLMTLHAAKGLEFPVVFVTGVEEGLLPLAARGDLDERAAREHLAEERRLFFVGMTRAADALFLTRARQRVVRGALVQPQESRFLREIPPELLTDIKQVYRGKRGKNKPKQLSLF